MLLIPAHSLGGSGRKQTDGDEVDLDGKRTGFPGVLGGVYGPIKGFLQCDASFEASIRVVDGQGGGRSGDFGNGLADGLLECLRRLGPCDQIAIVDHHGRNAAYPRSLPFLFGVAHLVGVPP